MTSTLPAPDPAAAPDEPVIDNVRPEDIETVARLEAESFPTPWHLESFRDALTRPYALFLALRDGGELIGYSLSWLVADELHLLKLAVRHEHRRRGHGRRLLEVTRRRAIALGAAMIWLEVRPSNEAGLALYQGAGFRHSYTRKSYYTDTHEDALILVCSLTEEGAAR
jgi:ribosomal-protein-alanine N-acetyltransferase